LGATFSLFPHQKVDLAGNQGAIDALLTKRKGEYIFKHRRWLLGDVFESEEVHRIILFFGFFDPEVVEVTPAAQLLLDESLPLWRESLMEVLLFD